MVRGLRKLPSSALTLSTLSTIDVIDAAYVVGKQKGDRHP